MFPPSTGSWGHCFQMSCRLRQTLEAKSQETRQPSVALQATSSESSERLPPITHMAVQFAGLATRLQLVKSMKRAWWLLVALAAPLSGDGLSLCRPGDQLASSRATGDVIACAVTGMTLSCVALPTAAVCVKEWLLFACRPDGSMGAASADVSAAVPRFRWQDRVAWRRAGILELAKHTIRVLDSLEAKATTTSTGKASMARVHGFVATVCGAVEPVPSHGVFVA